MELRQLDRGSFVHAYNVDLQLLYPWDGVVEPPFGAAWAVLAPGESTKPHSHQECETFFVAQGHGVFRIGDERYEVEPGSVTFHEPFHNHVLTNTSDEEELLFLTVWWEDKGRWAAGNGGAAHDHDHHDHDHDDHDPLHGAKAAAPVAAAPAAEAVKIERVLVTAAPPTPNGDLHLGHLAGPYLAADFHARAMRLAGLDAHYVVGSDDNSVYVKTQGESIGLGPAAAAKQFTDAIEETLEMAGVRLTAFPRPNASPHHRRLTADFFRTLYDKGAFEEREEPTPWCEGCERFCFEPYVSGRCPNCDGGVVGNTCEECGRINQNRDLAGLACTTCGEEPVLRPLRRLVFPLSRHADFLRDYYRRVAMNHHLRSLVEGVLADGPPDVAVTMPTDWGIAVPIDGWDDQRIYVWLEMAPRYFAYAEHVEEASGSGTAGEAGWQRWWKSPASRVVQCFGYDNGFYYGMLLPALWHAFDPEVRLPAAFVTNEFYRLDGAKFSTSRDHRILGRDLLARAPSDAVRFYLAWSAPEREQTNFTLDDFHAVVRRELVEGWQPWLHSLGARLATAFDGAVPATGDWTGEHRRFYHRLEEIFGQGRDAWSAEGFSAQRAVRLLAELVREGRRFGAGERHWDGVAEGHGEERRTGMALEVLAVKVLALLAGPVMPGFAGVVWKGLGYGEDGPGDGAWETGLEWVPAGQGVRFDGELVAGLEEYLQGV